MKWVRIDGRIEDQQTGELICLIAKTPDVLRDKIIELGPEMFSAIFSFVEGIENGKFAARSVYNELREILDKVPKEVFRDQRLIA